MTTILDMNLNIDPAKVQVNRRFRGNHFLQPEVRAAMGQIKSEAFVMASRRWLPVKGQKYSVRLILTFRNARSDIDGPSKRVLDSVFDGLREVYGTTDVNDSRVAYMTIEKRVNKEEPGIRVVVMALDMAWMP